MCRYIDYLFVAVVMFRIMTLIRWSFRLSQRYFRYSIKFFMILVMEQFVVVVMSYVVMYVLNSRYIFIFVILVLGLCIIIVSVKLRIQLLVFLYFLVICIILRGVLYASAGSFCSTFYSCIRSYVMGFISSGILFIKYLFIICIQLRCFTGTLRRVFFRRSFDINIVLNGITRILFYVVMSVILMFGRVL